MTTQRTPITADTARFTFYDIESLADAFTLCAYTPMPQGQLDELEIFFLSDHETIAAQIAADPNSLYQAIVESNPGLPAVKATVSDLRTEKANSRLAKLVGLSSTDLVNNRRDVSLYPPEFRPVCDTDDEYNPTQHPFLAGYNSLSYDTVMVAKYLSEVFPNPHNQPLFQPTTAQQMRTYNDQLFGEFIDYMPRMLGWDSPAAKIRRAMIQSGRHLDVARLNEQQWQVSLKRLLGMLGYQIKESEKLSHDTSITTVQELHELLAYNVSDCLGLAQLFRHPTYASNFDLKAGLLAQYSETVYERNGTVRRDRLTIDSSSAKFVGRILAPYKPLGDIETVSFDYPTKTIADEQRRKQINVLEHCLHFFETRVVPDRATNPKQAAAYEQFMQVVRYYQSIEKQNFNDSEEYREKFQQGPAAQVLKAIPKTPNNVPYFLPDGSPSSCFATFSFGGIHGAEADMETFKRECTEYNSQIEMIAVACHTHADARGFVRVAKEQHNQLHLPDGSTVDKRLVLYGSDPQKVKYRKPKKDDPVQVAQLEHAQALIPDAAALLATQRPDEQKFDVIIADSRQPDGTYRIVGKTVLANTTEANAAYRDQPAMKKPELFVEQKGEYSQGSTKLHSKYARTSAGLVIHEDFTSYYPNLLRNMQAFYNPELGEDRYAKIFFDKERYGREMKQPGISQEEKTRLNTLRNGTKLILNSASGAGDAAHKNPIRMNNTIISMRIIGQLFSWLIGQAQTLAGARIISTNTDGLYSVVGGENGFDEATNNAVLKEQQAAIGVDIEPELMFLISKDSNNRLEIEAPSESRSVADSPILAAGGGTLACHKGPRPDKSLAHPAVIDFALARYLQTVANRGETALAESFDDVLGRKMILEAIDPDDPIRTLLLFQNVIAASRGSITYPFAADPVDVGSSDGNEESEDSSSLKNPRALQMVNRVFIVRDGTVGAVSLHNAGAWKVNADSQHKRRANGKAGVRHDPMSKQILRHHGWARSRSEVNDGNGLSMIPDDRDVVVRRINGIDPTWSMLICNDDLRALPRPEIVRIIRSLDLEIYLQILKDTFTKNWMNVS